MNQMSRRGNEFFRRISSFDKVVVVFYALIHFALMLFGGALAAVALMGYKPKPWFLTAIGFSIASWVICYGVCRYRGLFKRLEELDKELSDEEDDDDVGPSGRDPPDGM